MQYLLVSRYYILALQSTADGRLIIHTPQETFSDFKIEIFFFRLKKTTEKGA